MIIDSEKNLEKQLNKFNKIYSKMEGPRYFRFDAFKEMGFSGVNHFKDYYKNNWLSKLLNKPIKEKEKIIKAFKAGTLPGTTKVLWIEQQSFLKNMFIIDSPVPSEKASFIYVKQLLKKNEKILYIAQDKECIDNMKKFTVDNKIDCVIAEKICMRIFKINNESYSLLSVMLNYDSSVYPLHIKILEFFLGSSVELTQEGIDKSIANMTNDFSSIPTSLQRIYGETRNILINKMTEIRPFLSETYDGNEDVFLNLMKNKSLAVLACRPTIAAMVAVCARICFVELIAKKQEHPEYKYPKLIFPDVEKENSYGNFYFNVSLGRQVQMVNFIYSNKENSYVKNNTSIWMKHIKGNLYHINTDYDDAIIDVKE